MPSHPPTNRSGEVPDEARTFRSHAGEGIEDTRNWPGIILMALGLLALALTLVAAGDGFEGWSVIGGIATVVCFAAGGAVLLLEHRRVKNLEGKPLRSESGH
jgi:hypothetical protein